MPFRAVRAEMASRMLELRAMHNAIASEAQLIPLPATHNTMKGLFVVSLYGFLEYSLGSVVRVAVDSINGLNVKHKHLTHSVMTIALDALHTSAANTKLVAKWEKRYQISHKFGGVDIAQINESVFGYEIQNTGSNTIEIISKSFSINEPFFYELATPGYINEIRENRNAVAHGRETPAAIGQRYTPLSLEVRMNQFENQMTHTVIGLERMITLKLCIKPNCRRLYP